jgi:DNA processing protein
MTTHEAVALAVIGNQDRRLLAAILRVATGRATSDDLEALPPRESAEPLVTWTCRSRSAKRDDESWVAECQRVQALADAQLAQARRAGTSALCLMEAAYPALLAAIPDPPPVLWVRGRIDVLTSPAIAVVGSRAASPYGLEMAKRLAGDLAAAGVVIVSGLARGVDSAAHVAALRSNGRTIGVLGCGLDRVYPAEHRDLAADMTTRGAVVSEFPIGVPPLPHHFPLRNRIISGLSRAVVVVEAAEKSGALITASAALEQGREVMVVPGPASAGRNRGGHLLIRDGARLVESADDILGEMTAPLSGAGAESVSDPDLDRLPKVAAFTVDEVAEATGEPANVVLSWLLDLELTGKIQRIGGGRFVRAGGKE